ncbi:hypothetical protein MDUV_46250 [Mycolicibacterium duvalii]|uniref:Uncharacterized protein n=1 Tax=Mycolicibacterium duvalii TaxID=39688 RepID=A0A7I7K6P7_9MYCO|nr:hypothetical protein MDUV_46250 [Mycolicibacterium duvalii]
MHRARIVEDDTPEAVPGGDPCDGGTESDALHDPGDVNAETYIRRIHLHAGIALPALRQMAGVD